MNTHIKNPARHSKRSTERRARRQRPDYPEISAGRSILCDRPEVGTTHYRLPVDPKTWLSPTQTLHGQFVFKRSPLPISRSKYTPHVGNRQDAKLCAKLAR